MKCPLCDGDGGELDPVTDEGLGPYYDCGWCYDGEVGLYMFLIAKYEWWRFWGIVEKVKQLIWLK